SGLGNSARTWMVPVFKSIARSMKIARPLCGNTLPSARISSSVGARSGGTSPRPSPGTRLTSRKRSASEMAKSTKIGWIDGTVASDVGLGLPEIRLRLIELGARTIHDRGVLGASQVGLRFGELGAGRLQRRPVFVLLDHEQHLATLNLGALLEPHLLENALDS